MADPKKMYIEFSDVWDKLVQRSELSLRIHGDESLVLTEDYKEIILDYFSDAARNLKNNYIGFLAYKDFEDTLIYELDVSEEGYTSMRALIERAILHFCFSEWYRTTGAFELAAEARMVYEESGKELKHSSVQSSFVRPKPRPYF